ncbi:MAG: hypothetical protein ACREHG_04370, partial [Candidatus Saccharimonadales bacterium]
MDILAIDGEGRNTGQQYALLNQRRIGLFRKICASIFEEKSRDCEEFALRDANFIPLNDQTLQSIPLRFELERLEQFTEDLSTQESSESLEESHHRYAMEVMNHHVSAIASEHIYTLLMASDGSYIEDLFGLRTAECLEYLLSLARPKRIVISYAFEYDLNMILGDIPIDKARILSKTGRARIIVRAKNGVKRQYYLHWNHRKKFIVSRGQGPDKKSVTIWDIFGYFQRSFVKACQE